MVSVDFLLNWLLYSTMSSCFCLIHFQIQVNNLPAYLRFQHTVFHRSLGISHQQNILPMIFPTFAVPVLSENEKNLQKITAE